MEHPHIHFFVRVTKMLLVVILIYFVVKLKNVWLPFLHMLIKLITPFLIAAFITYLLHPVVESIHRRGMPRALAILFIYALFFGGVGFAIYKGTPLFIAQLEDLNKSLPMFVRTYEQWTTTIHEETATWPYDVHKWVEALITEAESFISEAVTGTIIGLKQWINRLIVFLIIPFIAFYMLKDVELIKKTAWELTPNKWRKKGVQFLRDVDKTLGGYIRGQLFVCLLIGTAATISFWLIGMKYPLLLGIIVGVTNVIPYFGPIIGAIPAAIIAATVSMNMLLLTVGIIFVLQFIEGNILSPLIVGKSLHLHPLIIMFSLFVGGEVGGVLGLIVAVPIVAIAKATFTHIRSLKTMAH
ncbi:Predicted PurR-regulated permease PerM [Anoxybacillus pushchinoensis]|uniref:Predicted PurR-regulated permease PerM n=1 Tax=Anoxybacillus pushchinoensis TaxID=150248 RepID=A0A1I0TWL7_9BACL|nr:AI-2E family transporter [Anoxybacillus pushchinoensis]SFA56138.1 Predicted PurR-regulated permease PerM [Anoxybacillus pushchinoensis]